jgi:hypothetical protein
MSKEITLPKYVVEKVNGVWEVYNTQECVVEDVWKEEAQANEHRDKLIKKDIKEN